MIYSVILYRIRSTKLSGRWKNKRAEQNNMHEHAQYNIVADSLMNVKV